MQLNLHAETRRWIVLASWLLLAACGGGGGSGDGGSSNGRQPLATLSQDILPDGPRVDVSADDFFAVAAGDAARFQSSTPFVPYVEVLREVLSGPDAQGRFTVRESVVGQAAIDPVVERWQRTPAGLLALDYQGDGAPTGFRALVGDILHYPTPFYPVGATRTLIRQGGLGADLDGDGTAESFRFEFHQVLVGFETGQRGGRAERRARFRNRVVITIQPSSLAARTVVSEYTEEVVFAARTGLISATRRLTIDGADYSDYAGPAWLLSGTLAGRDANTAWNAGTTRYVELRHYEVAYDPVHNRYYAGLALSDPRAPGSVARIDPSTGEVAFSVPLGGEVRSVALSADGSTLYASMQDRAEVVRLSLPELGVLQRIALPAGTWAFSLAVSPLDAGTFAYFGDNFGGLRLVRNGVLQPNVPTQVRAELTTNPMVFTPDGAHVLMYGLTVVPSGAPGPLLKLPVLPDGISGDGIASGESTFGRSLSFAGDRLLAGSRLFSLDLLAPQGPYADTSFTSCVRLRGVARWACQVSQLPSSHIGVVDEATVQAIPDGTIPFGRLPNGSYAGNVLRIAPGPVGQVALTVDGGGVGFLGDWLVLFDNPDLR